MRKVGSVAAALFAAGLPAAPAGASVIVLGNSIGYQCYQAAKARDASNTALQSCNNALKSGLLNAHDVVATYVNRGIVRVYQSDYDDAVADFDRAIALNPNEAESYLNKGSTILRMGGDAQQAIALLSESLERKTDRPELAYYSRAVAHEVSGNILQAYRDYKSAQAAAPEWGEPTRQLSRFTVRKAADRSD